MFVLFIQNLKFKMITRKEPFKVFVPTSCLHESSGILIGCLDIEHRHICITSLLKSSARIPDFIVQSFRESGELASPLNNKVQFGVVGIFENGNHEPHSTTNGRLPTTLDPSLFQNSAKTPHETPLLHLTKNCANHINISWKIGAMSESLSTEFVVILLDANKFSRSVFFSQMDVDSQSTVAIVRKAVDSQKEFITNLPEEIRKNVVDLCRKKSQNKLWHLIKFGMNSSVVLAQTIESSFSRFLSFL